MDSTVSSVTDSEVSYCIEYNLLTLVSRCIIAALIFFSNLLTIAALVKAKKGIGQNAKLYIMSLSCADFLACPIVIADVVMVTTGVYCLSAPNTDAITEDIVWKKRFGFSLIWTLALVSNGCSLLTLACIAIDRLCAVAKPIFYKHNLTKFKIRCIIAVYWLYQIFLNTWLTFYTGARGTSPERIFFAPDTSLVMTDHSFSKILVPHVFFCIMINLSFFTVTIFYIRRLDAKKTSQSKGESFKRTKTFIKMSGMTLVSFFILWFPYLIVNSIVNRSDPAPWLKDYLLRITYSIVFSNSWINPILFCYFNKDYRQAYKRMLESLLCFKWNKVHSAKESSAPTTRNSQLN